MPLPDAFRAAVGALLAPDAVIAEPEQLRTYECDALTGHRAMPRARRPAAARPRRSQAVVRLCHEHGVPFVARGAGTGLSGGALPVADGIVISLARLNRILEVDLERGRVVVEPGVTNLDVTRAVAADGLLLRARPVEPAGLHDRRQRRRELRRRALPEVRLHRQPRPRRRRRAARRRARRRSRRDDDGPDLLGAFVGSEGTLGIAVRVTRAASCARPRRCATLLAAFDIDRRGRRGRLAASSPRGSSRPRSR